MKLNQKNSQNNFYSFLWHATFLALAKNFMDIDTIIPSMMIDAGGTAISIGILTAILIAGGEMSQLIFSPFLNNKQQKKKFLLIGINIRLITLLGMAILFFYSHNISGNIIIFSIFSLITIFSFSGGFTNISYMDILGKSIFSEKRKHFFSLQQVIGSVGLLASAYLSRYLLKINSYPKNYTILFFIATLLLGIATLGFWKIREIHTTLNKTSNFKNYLVKIKKEFKSNYRLKNYLLLINTQGIILTLMPFLILYSKQTFIKENHLVGNYLFLKILGGVLTGTILFFLAKKVRYHYLLFITTFVSIFILLWILIFPITIFFPYIFLFGGAIYTLYAVSKTGILLEISTHDNRAIYTGLAGLGSIFPAIFPILGGWIISHFGFNVFLIIFILILTSSIYFICKLNCKK